MKSGCEKSWAEVQADGFSFDCRGCAKKKELEMELEQLSGGTDDEVGEDD